MLPALFFGLFSGRRCWKAGPPFQRWVSDRSYKCTTSAERFADQEVRRRLTVREKENERSPGGSANSESGGDIRPAERRTEADESPAHRQRLDLRQARRWN